MTVQTYIAYTFTLYCFHVVTSVLGIYINDVYGIGSGNVSFNMKKDAVRMGFCSFIALAPPLFIYYNFRSLRVVLIYSLLFVFSVLLVYLGIGIKEVLVVAAANLGGFIVFRILVTVAPLWFLYLLLFAGLVFLISKTVKAKTVQKQQALADIKNEGLIRSMAARDPRFQTFCYNCGHFNDKLEYCQRKIDNQPVHEIQKGDKTLCASWISLPN